MTGIKEILTLRIKKEKEKRASYIKYIFNSHLVMFLLIVFGAIIFNYSNWVNSAKKVEIYSVTLTLQLLMAYFITNIKVKTYVKEADSIFLLPQEINYKSIIKSSIFSTIITKILIIIFFIGACYPLIEKLEFSILRVTFYFLSLVLSSVFFTIYKYYKVFYNKLRLENYVVIYVVYILTIMNFIFSPIPNLIFIFSIFIFFNFKKNMNENINWYEAAEYDNNRNEKYLKFINMFVDIPINTVKVSRRKYLDILLPKLNNNYFKQNNAYNYYYLRAFLRQENTIFLIVRISIIAILFIYNFKNMYINAFIIMSFNYLSIIQLIPLYKRLDSLLWCNISPVNNKVKLKSFKNIILKTLLIFNVILLVISSLANIGIKAIIIYICALFLSLLINKYLLDRSI